MNRHHGALDPVAERRRVRQARQARAHGEPVRHPRDRRRDPRRAGDAGGGAQAPRTRTVQDRAGAHAAAVARVATRGARRGPAARRRLIASERPQAARPAARVRRRRSSAAAHECVRRLGTAHRDLHRVIEPSVVARPIERLEREEVGDVVARVQRGAELRSSSMIRSTAPSLRGSPAGTSSIDALARRRAPSPRTPPAPLSARSSIRPGRVRVDRRPVVHGDRGALDLHPRALDVRRRPRRPPEIDVVGNRPGREAVRSDQAGPRRRRRVARARSCVRPGDGRDHAVAIDES